jgi:hypothetical protein
MTLVTLCETGKAALRFKMSKKKTKTSGHRGGFYSKIEEVDPIVWRSLMGSLFLVCV